ncbi:MAG: hypothetical protein H0Z38_00050 [Firmicutes bacterium]|nr:hypothetical protein [Bacillota bacterium]
MLTALNGEWTDLKVRIDQDEALRYLGYKGRGGLTPRIQELIRELSQLAEELAQPRGIGMLYPVQREGESLRVESLCLAGPRTLSRLGPLCQAYLFSVTIGEELEKEVVAFFASGEYTKGAVLDSLGSSAVESLAAEVNKRLREQVRREGLLALERISPGYGDWPLEDQFQLYPLTKAAEIGVKLTDSGLLIPRKSITALIGIRPGEAGGVGEDEPSGCTGCDLSDCLYRRGEVEGD